MPSAKNLEQWFAQAFLLITFCTFLKSSNFNYEFSSFNQERNGKVMEIQEVYFYKA